MKNNQDFDALKNTPPPSCNIKTFKKKKKNPFQVIGLMAKADGRREGAHLVLCKV